MQWVSVDNDHFKLTRLSNMLVRNGFSIHTRQINFDVYYCFNVPTQYDLDQFVNRLPIVNEFILKDRIVMIKL